MIDKHQKYSDDTYDALAGLLSMIKDILATGGPGGYYLPPKWSKKDLGEFKEWLEKQTKDR
jgi:hypothetical protein